MTNQGTMSIDEQIGDIFARVCKNNEYFGNDGWYELHTPTAREEIKRLISDQVAKARIQELELLRKRWNVEYLRDAIDDRIAQLRSTQ